MSDECVTSDSVDRFSLVHSSLTYRYQEQGYDLCPLIRLSTTATVRIQRFNPDNDKKPYMQEFKVPLTSDTTILDALHYIKAELDGSLTFRRSCRHAICGSCAMNVNGRNMLVCKTPLTRETGRQGPRDRSSRCPICRSSKTWSSIAPASGSSISA